MRHLCAGPLDWRKVENIARLHDVGGLVYKNLRVLHADWPVPEGFLDFLKAHYFKTCFQNEAREKDFSKLLPGFAREGIPVLLLKGSAMLHTVYDDPGVRRACDIDLLVGDEDVPRAAAVLLEAGYCSPGWERVAGEWIPGRDLHPPMFWNIQGTVVEFHTHIIRPRKGSVFDVKTFWDRAREVEFGAEVVKVPSPEDMLLHQCLHVGFVHIYFSSALRDLRDIAELLTRHKDELDWDYLGQLVRRADLEDYLYYPVYLASRLFNCTLDGGALRGFTISPWMAQVTEECALLSRHLFSDLRWKSRRKWAAKAEFLWGLARKKPSPLEEVYRFPNSFQRSLAHYRWIFNMLRLGVAVKEVFPAPG